MIEGNLVNLRSPEMADLERNTQWINDREVTRFLSMRYGMSQAAEEVWMKEVCAKPTSYERAFFAIETKDGVHIGNTNLFNAQAADQKCELGIMIGDKTCWSQGYGADALRTLVMFGFDEMNMNRIQLFVFDFNERAQACYRKVGFVDEGRRREALFTEGAYHDVLLMSVLRDEWQRPA